MPVVTIEPDFVPTLTPQAPPMPEDAPASSLMEVAGAYTTLDNLVVNAARDLTVFAATGPHVPDPKYMPEDDLEGYEDWAYDLLHAVNAEDMALRKARIDQQLGAKAVMANAGPMGAIGGVLMGAAIDPLSWVPLGVAAKTKTFSAGFLQASATTAAIETGREAYLQQTQATRTAGETAANIGGAVALTGLLGGAIGSVRGAQFRAMEAAVQADLDDISAVSGKGAPRTFGDSTAGAAQVGTAAGSELKGLGAARAALKPVPDFMKGPAYLGAVSESRVMREMTEQLADTSLIKNKNQDFVASATSVENAIKAYDAHRANFYRTARDHWKAYRKRVYGGVPFADRLGTGPEGSLTRKEFFEEVGRAVRRNDTHAIPEVQAVARAVRQEVFDPILKEGVDVGLFDNVDMQVKTADSWLWRRWDKQKINADYDRFKQIIVNHLTAQEKTKVADRAFLEEKVSAVRATNAEIRALERRIERRGLTKEKLEARAEEVRAMNAFAFKRSQELSEPLDKMRSEVDSITRKIQSSLDELDDIRAQIAEERADIPGIKEIDSQILKLVYATSDLNKNADIIDMIDASDALEEGIAGLKAALKDTMEALKGQRADIMASEIAGTLKTLEKQRAAISKKISPFRRRLRELRTEVKKVEARRKPLARGGAVFETKIRGRGNALADTISGKEFSIEDLQAQLKQKRALLEQVNKGVRERIAAYEGKSAKAARSIMERAKKAEPGKAPSQNAIMKEVMRAAKRIARSQERMDAEVDDLAAQIIDRLTGLPGGRLAYDVTVQSPGAAAGKRGAWGLTSELSKRGPERARVFNIPDELVEDFLVNDIREIVDPYVRTMGADVELMRAFGTLEYDEALKRPLVEDYRRMVSEVGGDANRISELRKSQDKDARNLQAMWEKLRGFYAAPDDYAAPQHVLERGVLAWNYARLLGGMTLSSIPDVGRHVMVHGLERVTRDGLLPVIDNLKAMKAAGKELGEAGVALDMTLSSTAHARANVDDWAPVTGRIDAVSDAITRHAGNIFLINQWNTVQKTFAGVVTQSRMMRAIQRFGAGEKLGQKEIENLASHGIGEDMALRIAEQFEKYGAVEKGSLGSEVFVPNARTWDDVEARRLFRAAVRKQVDEVIVTPGMDRPLWMSRPGWRLVGQFRSYSFSSMQRVALAGLQQGDMNALSGLIIMTGLGMMVYATKTMIAGRELSDNPAVWVSEGVDRAGVTGWLFDINNVLEKATSGGLGVNALVGGPPMSRYASRNAVGAVAGPTYGTAHALFNLTGALGSGEWSARDTHTLRQLIPFQNTFYLSWAFYKAEEGANQALGVQD
jgi:hypothetical protein